MRPSISVKTLYRSPIKTLLTFILLGVVTFAFFSQTAEYAITTREFGNAAKQYCGVGSAEVAPLEESRPGDPHYIATDPRVEWQYREEIKQKYLNRYWYRPLTKEQISEISSLPYITSADTRYMTAGISDTFYRLDDGTYFYNYTARCVVEGTLTEVQYGTTPENPMMIQVEQHFNRLIFEDFTLLAGNPNWAADQEKLMIYAQFQKAEYMGGIGTYLERTPCWYTSNYIYDTEYVRNMTPGGRYVVVIRFEPLIDPNYGSQNYLSDHLSNSWCDAVWPVDSAPADYLVTEKFTAIRELIEITNADTHTFDIVYTDDMSAIMRFAAGSMSILDGRILTKEDSVNASSVCVISRELAKENALKVGDTITMKLGTELFEQYKGLGAVAATRERYKPPEKTVTLEIVGIYADTDGANKQSREPNWSYSINTVFVPKSLLPIDSDTLTGHVFSPGEFSFKVENAWDIPAFLEESAPRFEEMGLNLIFNDDGWPDMAKGFQAAQELSLIKIAVLSAAVAAATWFVVYLLIGRKKKEYAVMRALGTTKKISSRALILPLMAVAAVSVLAGSGAAWVYTVKTIAHNNTLSQLKEYAVSPGVPAGAAIGCIMGELLLIVLFALILLRRIGALSPLSLLQDNSNRRKRDRSKTSRVVKSAQIEKASLTMTAPPESRVRHIGAPIEKAAVFGVPEPVKEIHKSRSLRFVLKYIGKHIRRSAGKSVLSVLLAALLFGAVGQLALMKQSYTELCTNTVITANFVGGLFLDVMPSIIRSGYVINPYYEAKETLDLNFSTTSIVYTNNIARYMGEEADIIYADGYDASCMDTFGETLIAGKTLMLKNGLEPGDTVTITSVGFLANLNAGYIKGYRDTHWADGITDEEILALYQDEIQSLLNMVARTFTIAGIVSTASGAYDDTAFTPGTTTASPFYDAVKLDVAEFTLADNFCSDEFRSFGKKIAGGSATDGVILMMDTSKLENLRNTLRLLETMYPIALTAALLIGGFLCCLVIVQSSKEAAIMRILGMTKRRMRTMLTLEQMILSIAGLVIGACGLLAFKAAELAVVAAQLGLFAALYFAVILVSAVICSVLATRRNVLELLQTKE